MSICVRLELPIPKRATGRVAYRWVGTLFLTEPLCDGHQMELCRILQERGIRAFAVSLDYEQRMEQARATYAQCSGSEG